MQNVIVIVTFQLNDMDLLNDWKKMSDGINESLKKVDGFIYRDSTIAENNKVNCIVKWESAEKQAAFRKHFDNDPNMQSQMQEFARIVNMETMSSELLKVI